ncbi:uncharacterized protein [Equus caballus]|uniref:uncharacterized protein isoform X4 n=1 Tax=Equus caballus TaxID=9796 RepID=UPI0038B23642
MDSPGPKGRGLSRPSRGLETSGWEQIPPLALGGCSPPPFAGLLCTQRSPRLWKLLPCCGVYWILGSLRSSATDKCSRMAQHTLDPVTSSGQKLQHGGPPEVDAETEFIETPLSMSGWTLSPTASHGLVIKARGSPLSFPLSFELSFLYVPHAWVPSSAGKFLSICWPSEKF